MNKKILAQLTLICLFVVSHTVTAQLTITNSQTAQQLVDVLKGTNPGVTISGVTFKAGNTNNQFAKFSNGDASGFPLKEGIFLTTGTVNDSYVGPFAATKPDFAGNYERKSAGDNDLTALLTSKIKPGDPAVVTKDAAVLEFDFTSTSNNIEFNYVFASTEFFGYACSRFYDMFAFFLTGDKPGGGSYTNENLAVVPGTSTPVCINTINNGSIGNYKIYFQDNYIDNTFNLPPPTYNGASTKIISNGLTVPLKASAKIICGRTYHIKIVIADANDGQLDSYVYLEAGSFKSDDIQQSAEIKDANGVTLTSGEIVEGCTKALLNFSLNNAQTTAYDVNYSITGSATNPDDYTSTSQTKVTIPAGSKNATLTIDPIADGKTEGDQTVIIQLTSTCTTPPAPITITIKDQLKISATGTKPTCTTGNTTPNTDGSVSVSGSNGKSPYDYSFSNATYSSTSTISNLTQTTSYNVKVKDSYGCIKDTNVNLSKTCPSTSCTNPGITSQPLGVTKCEGLNTSFSVVATGITSTSLSYQWQIDKCTGTFYDTVGATNATLNLLSIKKSWNNYKYKCIVTESTNGPCSTPSDPATLTVDTKPTATSSGSATICLAGTAVVSGVSTTNVTATGYSWSENGDGSISAGANTLTPTYTPDIKDTTKTITLTMVSTSANSCPNPANVTYTVKVDPLPIAKAGGNTSICVSGTATVIGAYSKNSTIKWTENGAGSITSLDDILTPTYTPDASDAGNTVTLTMASTSTNSCPNPADVIYTVKVTSIASPTGVAGGPSSVCAKKAITLAGASSANGTNLWTITTGNGTLTNETTITPTYTSVLADTIADVELNLKVSPGSGCTGTAVNSTHKITVNRLPKVIPTATIGCLGTNITLDGNSISGASYKWSGPNGFSQSIKTAIIPNITPADTGLYELKIKDGNSCIDSTKIRVSIYPVPAIVGDTFVCVGSSITLSGGNNSTATSWISQTPTNLTIDPASGLANGILGGVTTVEYIDANGCKDEQLIVTEDLPKLDFIVDSTSICLGNDVKFIDKSPVKFTNIVWDFGDGNQMSDPDPSYTYQKVDSFTVSLSSTSPNGCEGKLTKIKYITPIDVPTMKFGFTPDSIDMYNPEIQFINYSTAKFFTWNFGDFSPVSNEKNPLHTFPETPGQAYKVTLKGSNSLSGVCPISVHHEIVSIDPAIYFIPNSFTPNGDEINNTFQPIFTSGYDPQNYSFWIYNRLGELIFETHNAAIGWDGTFGGKLAENNTYVWKLQFKSKQTEKEFYLTGHVNLVK